MTPARATRSAASHRALMPVDEASLLHHYGVFAARGLSKPRPGPLPATDTTPRRRRPDQGTGEAHRLRSAGRSPQDLVIEGDVTPPAMRPRHPPPRRRAAGAAGQGGGGIVPRHRGSKAAPIGRSRHRHGPMPLVVVQDPTPPPSTIGGFAPPTPHSAARLGRPHDHKPCPDRWETTLRHTL